MDVQVCNLTIKDLSPVEILAIYFLWLEIEGYSVAYFDHITVFQVLYSVKGGAHTCFIDA